MKNLLIAFMLIFSAGLSSAQTINNTPTIFVNGVGIAYGDTPPLAVQKIVWFDTVAGYLKIYNGSSWIPASVAGSTQNLSIGTITGNAIPLNISGGSGVTIPEATGSLAGLLSASDKAKLNNTSGANTGDQNSVSGNAGTATALQTPRTIWGQSFDGTVNVSGAFSGATTGDFSTSITTPFIANTASANNARLGLSNDGFQFSRNIADGFPVMLVNSISGTGNIVNYQSANVTVASINNLGRIGAAGIFNLANANNSLIYTNATGALIQRNVADANPVASVNQSNASSTGNIMNWQWQGTTLAWITVGGGFNAPSVTTTAAAVIGTTVTAGGDFIRNGAAGTVRALSFRTANAKRWDFSTDNTSESGTNAGSNFGIYNYNDAGSLIEAPLSIVRSTGNVTLKSLSLSATPANATTNARHLSWNSASKAVEVAPDMYVINTGITVGQTKAQLNTLYPNEPVGFMVICPNIALGGAVYVKSIESGSSDTWQMMSAPNVS